MKNIVGNEKSRIFAAANQTSSVTLCSLLSSVGQSI